LTCDRSIARQPKVGSLAFAASHLQSSFTLELHLNVQVLFCGRTIPTAACGATHRRRAAPHRYCFCVVVRQEDLPVRYTDTDCTKASLDRVRSDAARLSSKRSARRYLVARFRRAFQRSGSKLVLLFNDICFRAECSENDDPTVACIRTIFRACCRSGGCHAHTERVRSNSVFGFYRYVSRARRRSRPVAVGRLVANAYG
jgi:hypothetical protein